jgi:hypothetical protein
MSRNPRHDEIPPRAIPIRTFDPCERVFVGLVLWTLIHTTEACAGDQPPVWGPAQNPDFKDLREPTSLSTWSLPVPATFRPLDVRAPTVPVTQDFRAHPHAAPPAQSSAIDGESMIRDTSVWQRLEQFRARNQVRVVTLWATGGNSLSLQAGMKGNPSLQWTSRLGSHGGAASGGAVGRSLHSAARSSSPEPGSKPGKSMDAGPAGVGGGPTR